MGPPEGRTETGPKKLSKTEAGALLDSITNVDVPIDTPVHANCDEVRRMINTFLTTSGVNQTSWLKAIGCASKSFNSFRGFKGKGAGAGNQIYPKAWRFFEQKHILEGKPKSAKRLEQEGRWGADGFPLDHDDGKRYVFTGDVTDRGIYDIEWCREHS